MFLRITEFEVTLQGLETEHVLLLQAVWHWAALSREWGRGCPCHPTDYKCHETTQVKLLYFNQSEWCIQPLHRKWVTCYH